MAQWFRENWYLALIFIGVCIVAAVVFYFAGKSYSSYRASYRKQEEEIKRLTALKGRFVPLTSEKIELSDIEETLEGVALSYQLKLQKSEDMEKEFSLMSLEKRCIYILDVFVSDKSVGEFFRQNGDILCRESTVAFSLIGMTELSGKIEQIRKMFDPLDEVTSLDERKIEEVQKYIDENALLEEIKLKAAEYIKANSQLFVN